MATGETGFEDVTYDLISVQYHSLKAGHDYGQYVRDAENAGLQDIAAFFREVMEQDSARARRCHEFLRQISGTEQGGPATHAVAGDPQLPGRDRHVPVAEAHPGEDLQGCFQVGGEAGVVGVETGLRVGGGNHDAPAGQVAEGLVVVRDVAHPVVAERHGGQVGAFLRGVHLAGQAGVAQVALEDPVWATLGEIGQFLQIRRHATENT